MEGNIMTKAANRFFENVAPFKYLRLRIANDFLSKGN
jgi:hypothetical protein